jgi:hypothetical protein
MGLEKLKAFKTLAGVKGNFGLVDAILFISILCYKFAERVQGSMFRVLGFRQLLCVARIFGFYLSSDF